MWDSISSACSSIGSAISDTFSSFSSTCSDIIDSVATHAPAISGALKALSIVIPHPYLKAAIAVVDMVLITLGLLGSNETTEEIGERVLHAKEANISPADFSSYDEYMEEIRNFEIDPEKSKDFNFGEKIAAGISVQAWGMEEKIGENSSELLALIMNDAPNLNKDEGYFTESRIEAILQSIDKVSNIVDFFKDKLDPDTRGEVESSLVDVEKSINPDMPIEDIYNQLDKQVQN